jgi:hypothetical protein
VSAVPAPANMDEALEMMESLAGCVADADATQLPAEALGRHLGAMERINAVFAAAQAGHLAAFDAKDGHLADGQRTLRTWLVNKLRATRRQASEYQALRGLVREHPVLLAGLREKAVTKSVALQLAQWTRVIPAGFRGSGRADPGRRGHSRGGPAGAGADLRGDPVPDRAAGPGRPGPGPGPGPVRRDHLRRGRGDPRRPDPAVRRDGEYLELRRQPGL